MTGSDKIGKYLEEFKRIQAQFLYFIENEENIEENFSNLKQLFEEVKTEDYQHKLRLFLRMLLVIANNHHRGPNFFSKIDQILHHFKEEIKKYFSNSEIFSICKSNKRILLFLVEDKIIDVDGNFVYKIYTEYLDQKYPQYFAPEIKPFINEDWFPEYNPNNFNNKNEWVKEIQEELPDNFNELRKIGENDSYLCKLIREDSIKDFIVYMNKNTLPLNLNIKQSIYETNPILNNNQIELIEYASYFGAVQIVNFLKNEGVQLESYLICYAIHSEKPELISFLLDNKKNEDAKYVQFLEVSIKCHHNDIANYFLNNYIQNEFLYYTFKLSLENYNFAFINNANVNESSFCRLCLYDYYSIVKVLLACRDININNKAIATDEIQNHIF